jgi:hypothetical protein
MGTWHSVYLFLIKEIGTDRKAHIELNKCLHFACLLSAVYWVVI